MAGNFSDYLETQIINVTLRNTAYAAPSNTYVALFRADPTDANAASGEVTTTNGSTGWAAYARVAAGAGTAGWSSSVNGVTSNSNALTFAANNGGSSVIVTHIGIYDTATGGNLLYYSALQSAKTLAANDVLSFGVGAITITID